MAEVQNQQSRECKHKGEKGLRINVQSFWCRWAPERFPRQLLGKSSRLLRVPLSRQILGGEAAFGAAHISWTPLSPVSGLKKSVCKQKSLLTPLLSNTGVTGVWMQFYFLFFYSIKVNLHLEHIKVYHGLAEISVSVCLPNNLMFLQAAEQYFPRVKYLFIIWQPWVTPEIPGKSQKLACE